jgi:hypothetical protein
MGTAPAASTSFSFDGNFRKPTTIKLDDDTVDVLKRTFPDIQSYLEMTLRAVTDRNPYASAQMVDDLVKREAYEKANAERLSELYRLGLSAGD